MQLALPLNIPAARTLVPMEAAVVLLDRSEEEIVAGIESGALSVAWDIGAVTHQRSEIRIYRDSLLAFLAGSPGPDPLKAVEADILPQRDIRSTEIRRWWSCSNNLVKDLIDGAQLRVTREPSVSSGPNSYRLLDRVSVLAFLQRRRLR